MNSRNILIPCGILTVFLQLSGCATLMRGEGDAPAVWSEDGRGIALVQYLQENDQISHQIAIQAPDGSARRDVTTAPRPGRVGQLYYLREAGYLLVETLDQPGWQKFDRIHLDGSELAVLEARVPEGLCPDAQASAPMPTAAFPPALTRHQVLPSPDGKLLAHLFSESCGQVTIEMQRAQDLITLSWFELPITAPVQATWHPTGHLVLAQPSTRQAWHIHVNEQPTPTDYPGCLEPATASNPISAAGKRISVSQGKAFIEDAPASVLAFGCQLTLGADEPPAAALPAATPEPPPVDSAAPSAPSPTP